MSEYDAATYERFSKAVRRQVQSLRIILDSLQVGFTPLDIKHYFTHHSLSVCVEQGGSELSALAMTARADSSEPQPSLHG